MAAGAACMAGFVAALAAETAAGAVTIGPAAAAGAADFAGGWGVGATALAVGAAAAGAVVWVAAAGGAATPSPSHRQTLALCQTNVLPSRTHCSRWAAHDGPTAGADADWAAAPPALNPANTIIDPPNMARRTQNKSPTDASSSSAPERH